MNQTAVINYLLSHGPATRAHIAKAIGLSSPTVGKVASELIAADVLEQIDLDTHNDRCNEQSIDDNSPNVSSTSGSGRVIQKSSKQGRPAGQANFGKLGRPGVLLEVNQTTPRFVLLQLGVRHTRLMARPLAGKIQDDWPIKFATPKSAAVMVKRLKAAAAKLNISSPWGVMVSTSGVVDEAQGRVLLAPNLHWTSQVNLSELLAEIWACPIHLVQEIRALALGQLKAAAVVTSTALDVVTGQTPTSADNFLLVDIGEGVGGAAVLDGKLFASNRLLSGELGHNPVSGNARKCGCGATGCLETLLSRAGLLQSFLESNPKKISAGDWSSLTKWIEKNGVDTWLRESLDAGAMIIAGAMNMLGVKRVVVTGALAELPKVVMDELSQRVSSYAMWGRFGNVECAAAPRQRAAGLMKAAMTRVVLAIEQPWEKTES